MSTNPNEKRVVSTGVYSPDKALAHPGRLNVLRAGGQPYPVHVHLILSDLCNLSCPKCAYRLEGYSSNELFKVIDPVTHAVNNNPNRMLDSDLVRSILDDCVEMGVKAVESTGGGEPLVHPDAWRLIGYGLDKGLDMALITNGLLLRRRMPAELVARLTWLRISIDAATEEMFGRVRPSLGAPQGENLLKVLDALTWSRGVLDDARSECVLGAGFVVQAENWREIHDATRIYRAAGAHNIRISGAFTPEKDRYFDGWREDAEELERRAVADFDDPDGSRTGTKFRVFGRFREKVADLQAPPDYDRCAYQHLTTYIAGDGNAYRCCVTAYNPHGLIGKIRDAGGFKALWDSQHKQERFASFDAHSCEQCQFNDRNRAINAAIDAPELPPEPPGIVHKNFV